MKSIRGRYAIAIAGAATALSGALVVSHANAQSDIKFTQSDDAGTLVLATDPDGSLELTWWAVGGASIREQVPIDLHKRDKCEIAGDEIGQLLSITVVGSSGAGIGLVGNGLGIRENNTCNTGNGRIADGQAFELSLGSLIPADVVIDTASLDIEGKFGASLELAIDGINLETEVLATSGSDNGPDSGASDNNPVDVGLAGDGQYFSTLTIGPGSTDGRGEISLEGGGDYVDATSYRTVFDLVRVVEYEYTLDCVNSSNPNLSGSEVFENALGLNATVVRYDSEGGAGCESIGANLDSDSLGVVLGIGKPDGQYHHLRLQIQWEVSLSDQDQLERSIELVPGSGVSSPVEWCDALGVGEGADLMDPSTAVVPVHPDDATTTDPDDVIPWCLLSDTRELRDGVIIQTQVYDGTGDPRFF